MSEINPVELAGLTFDEIAAKYGEEVAINAGIAADPEWGPSELDMSHSRPATEVAPHIVERLPAAGRPGRGKQKVPAKEHVSIRLDADLTAHFRKDGPGWQTRLNAALRKAVFDESA